MPKFRTARPFRLHNAKAQRFLHGCWYRFEDKSLNAAAARICGRGIRVGTMLEVINVSTGRVVATYTKHADGIHIRR